MRYQFKISKNFGKKFIEIQPYQHSLADPSEEGDERRQDIRKSSVACKPIVQRVLADVILELHIGVEEQDKVAIEETVSRINQLDWSPDNSLWQGILFKRG